MLQRKKSKQFSVSVNREWITKIVSKLNINKLGKAFERSGYEVKIYQNFPKEVVQELNPTENDEIYNKLENFLGVLKIKGNNLN